MYKRILIATDGSGLSGKAVASGIQLAASLGAEVVALKVVPRYPLSYFEGGIAIAPSEMGRIEEQWSAEALKVLEGVKVLGTKNGVKVKAVTMNSDIVSDTIIRCAKKHKCDLIVMASHVRKGIKRVLLGSETTAVLTHSHTPVLVLR